MRHPGNRARTSTASGGPLGSARLSASVRRQALMAEFRREEVCQRLTHWCAAHPDVSLGATEELVFHGVCQYGDNLEEIAADRDLTVEEVQAAWANLNTLADRNP